MKKALFVLASLAALGSLGYVGTWVAAQEGVKPAGATGENKPTLKIGVVNITRVIKDFKKANVLGDKILADAKRYDEELKADQEKLKAEQVRVNALPEAEKAGALKGFRQRENEFRDKESAYQQDIRKRRDDMAIEINKDIQRVMDGLARNMGLEMILTCPDVATKEEVGSLNDSMRRMTAPAVWVAWKNPGLDITDEVCRWLDYYCKPPAGAAVPATPMK